MPPSPPDTFGIGRALAIAAALLFAIRLVQGLRTWWARRTRTRIVRDAKAAAQPADRGDRPA